MSGANRGLGRALAEALVERGAAKVYAAARRLETLDDLRDARVVPVRLDVADTEQVTRAAELAADATLLMNNGGSLAFADPLTGDAARPARRQTDQRAWRLSGRRRHRHDRRVSDSQDRSPAGGRRRVDPAAFERQMASM